MAYARRRWASRFGPAPADIATITDWLTGHGFTVDEVTRTACPSASAAPPAQVQSAFHTEIHNLSVNGKSHIANMSDPQIPAALAPVVVGVKALHNFFPRPKHHMGQTVAARRANRQMACGSPHSSAQTPRSTPQPLRWASRRASPKPAPQAKPQFGISVKQRLYPYLVEDVGPWDFATIYNITPVMERGHRRHRPDHRHRRNQRHRYRRIEPQVTGANGNNDVATFRTFFDLPTSNSWNTPILHLAATARPFRCARTGPGPCPAASTI